MSAVHPSPRMDKEQKNGKLYSNNFPQKEIFWKYAHVIFVGTRSKSSERCGIPNNHQQVAFVHFSKMCNKKI